jgi:hypothetical protein
MRVTPPPPLNCPSCGRSTSETGSFDVCKACGKRLVEPVEFRICGTAMASMERMGRFERFVQRLDVTVRRAGDDLELTTVVPPEPTELGLPVQIGFALLGTDKTPTGMPDAFVKLAAGGVTTCRLPARGFEAGQTARFAVTHADAYQELERVIS